MKRLVTVCVGIVLTTATVKAQWTTNTNGDVQPSNNASKIVAGVLPTFPAKFNLGVNNANMPHVWLFGGPSISSANLVSKFNISIGASASLGVITSNTGGNGGIGVLEGPNLSSPIVWMYHSTSGKNAFSVARADYLPSGLSTIENSFTTLFQVRENGNVGIGTTAPSKRLEVVEWGDNASISSLLRIGQYNDGNAENGTGAAIEFASGNNYNSPQTLGKISMEGRGWLTKSRMIFSTKNATSGLTSQVAIDDNGNLGVGTITPSKKMEVVEWGNNASISTLMRLGQYNDGNAENGTGAAIEFASGNNYNSPQTLGKISMEGRGWLTKSRMIFSTKNATTGVTSQMVLDDNGNVGIGTTNPDAKLAVNGTIHTKEVKVDMNNWSDFVFNKDYKLRSLAEVQQYIEENHHLPDVPSEKEVLANGQNLGEMNAILLRKIEELTLYVLELKNQNQSLINRVQQLESKK